MSVKTSKIKHSKDQLRQQLASMSVDDKIRILEKLRSEELPKTESPKDSKSILSRFIQRTVQGQPRSQQTAMNSDDLKSLTDEIEAILADPGRGRDTLIELFPEFIPEGEQFYLRLLELQHHLGFNDTAHRAIGAFWLMGLQSLQPESAENLLAAFPTLKGPNFFMLLDSLGVVLGSFELRPEFGWTWYSVILKRIGNDLASGGFWKALEIFSEKQTNNAVTILALSFSAQDEIHVSIAAFMLGTIRAMTRGGIVLAGFERLDSRFADAPIGFIRKIFIRSWVQTAWKGKMTRADLELLATRASSGNVDDFEDTVWVFSRCVLSALFPLEAFTFGTSWLLGNISADISELAKHHVIAAATVLVSDQRFDAAQLLLAVQPVSPESSGTWNQIEAFLVSRLNKDVPNFVSLCLKLAERSAREWLAVMRKQHGRDWLLSEMQSKELGALAGELIVSGDVACRKLGFFLFDELHLNSLPTDLLAQAGEEKLRVALLESKRVIIHGEAIAKFLIALIPHMEKVGQELQNDFFDELVLQAKNYGGACRTEFERRQAEFAILQRALKTAESYFEDLVGVVSYAIRQIETPGFFAAARLYARRFSNDISKGAKDASVFATLFKNVQLLYGKRWRMYNRNKLGESSELKNFSAESEIPRLEFLDPEGMVLRRLHAASGITATSAGMASRHE